MVDKGQIIQPGLDFRLVMIIAGLIITLNLCSGIMGPKVIDLGPMLYHASVTCGVIPFCLAFFLMDVFTNQYGSSYAKQLSVGVAACNLAMALALYGLTKIPAADMSHETGNYQHQFDPMIRSFLAGTIATLIAFYINCRIFSKLFVYFKGKHLWLRCVGATSIGELVYSTVFDFVFFINRLNTSEIITIIINNYGFKFMFEVVTMPVTYLLVYLLSKYEYKAPIKYSNFKLTLL